MLSSITAVLTLGSLVEVLSWHLRHKVPAMTTNMSSQRRPLLITQDQGNMCTSESIASGSRGHHQYHEILRQLNPFETNFNEGLRINNLTSGFQLISQFVKEGLRILFHGPKLVSHPHFESLLLKVMLIFFIHILIRKNYSLELQLMATAFFHWQISSATVSPTPSFSSSLAKLQTPSLASFQSTVTNEYLARTLNSSMTVSKATETSSQTVNFEINMPVTDTKLARLQGICDDGWTHEGNLCYRVVSEAKMFNHAERLCVIHSAHLISIESKEENDKIFELIQTFIGQPGKIRIWLGMERLSSDSSLHWVDSKPLNYGNWAPGEPDQTGACVQMIQKGWWEDTSCTQKLPFICKKDSKAELPYSRTTELGILIGIPMACSVIMLSVVAYLFANSVLDSQGTFYAYGKTRNKDKIHSCLVRMSTGITHVGAVGYVNEGGDFNRTSIRSNTSEHSLPSGHSSEQARPPVDTPEITITPGTPEPTKRQQTTKVLATSSTSIEQDRFQSATSLEKLVSKRYIKPKTRKLRSLRKADAVVTPAGAAGKYIKKEERFEFYEI